MSLTTLALPSADDPARERPLPRWERLLLVAELGDFEGAPTGARGEGRSRSARDWIVDLAMFAYIVVSAAAVTINDRSQVGGAQLAVDAALAVPACLALWSRRRHPIAVAWLAVVASALSSAAAHAGLVALFSAAIHARPRRAAEVTVAAVGATAINCAIYTGDGHAGYNWNALAFWTVTTVAAFAVGSFVRVRRELVTSLQERARRSRSEQQLRVSEARMAERARIAREMHDVLAHRISLINVHAGALEVHPDAPADQVGRAATVIRMSARAAHDDLRDVLGVLRADAGESVEPPQPTVSDLPELIEESRRAGMRLSVVDRLAKQPPTELVGRTVYRIVQEALTNARRHAPGQAVSLTIAGDPGGELCIEVVNRPTPGGRDAAREEGAAATPGRGLVGLAERLALAGGALDCGPMPGGGFRLQARLPWTVPRGGHGGGAS